MNDTNHDTNMTGVADNCDAVRTKSGQEISRDEQDPFEREAAKAAIKVLKRELDETRKDYKCLAELLDGHDATECRANLLRMKQELARWRELPAKVEGLIPQTNIPLSAAQVRTNALYQVLDFIATVKGTVTSEIDSQIIPVTVDPDGDEKQIECVPAELARELKRELAEARKQRDMLAEALRRIRRGDTLGWCGQVAYKALAAVKGGEK